MSLFLEIMDWVGIAFGVIAFIKFAQLALIAGKKKGKRRF